MPQPEREVRGLRNDLRESCEAQAGRLEQVVAKLELLFEEDQLEAERAKAGWENLGQEGGVPIDVRSQTIQLDVGAPEGVEVKNPTDVAGVETAVEQNSETFNSTTWAIFGLVVGFVLLGVIWKLVRP